MINIFDPEPFRSSALDGCVRTESNSDITRVDHGSTSAHRVDSNPSRTHSIDSATPRVEAYDQHLRSRALPVLGTRRMRENGVELGYHSSRPRIDLGSPSRL